jgi:transposase
VEQVKAAHPEVHAAVTLLERFARLIRRQTEQPAKPEWTQWLVDARAERIPEVTAFVIRLEQDRSAVEAGLTLPYSQGQTEGQVNRLKTLKRTMYGRANFDRLRRRFLARA